MGQARGSSETETADKQKALQTFFFVFNLQSQLAIIIF